MPSSRNMVETMNRAAAAWLSWCCTVFWFVARLRADPAKAHHRRNLPDVVSFAGKLFLLARASCSNFVFRKPENGQPGIDATRLCTQVRIKLPARRRRSGSPRHRRDGNARAGQNTLTLATPAEIAENDFNSHPRYVDTFEEEAEIDLDGRPLSEGQSRLSLLSLSLFSLSSSSSRQNLRSRRRVAAPALSDEPSTTTLAAASGKYSAHQAVRGIPDLYVSGPGRTSKPFTPIHRLTQKRWGPPAT